MQAERMPSAWLEDPLASSNERAVLSQLSLRLVVVGQVVIRAEDGRFIDKCTLSSPQLDPPRGTKSRLPLARRKFGCSRRKLQANVARPKGKHAIRMRNFLITGARHISRHNLGMSSESFFSHLMFRTSRASRLSAAATRWLCSSSASSGVGTYEAVSPNPDHERQAQQVQLCHHAE